MEKSFESQTKSGERFRFGSNWASFLKNLSPDKLGIAQESLKEMLGLEDLKGKSFLDIGNGSGLFSLAARQLGATVHSFDFDPDSVQCALELRDRFFKGDPHWVIERGSALDAQFLAGLPKFDIVYSWGVLHHTGNMNLALENAMIPVKPKGQLFISIYNDQGWVSKFWLGVKKAYNANALSRSVVWNAASFAFVAGAGAMDLVRLRNPLSRYSVYKENRGMSLLHDWKDWVGGLPYEFASPGYIKNFYASRGFKLQKLKTCKGYGCNEFVFQRDF